jgi:hypothetical protein
VPFEEECGNTARLRAEHLEGPDPNTLEQERPTECLTGYQ